MKTSPFNTTVTNITALSDDISSFTFSADEGAPFSSLKAGAHIDIHAFDGAMVRQYSAWDWAEDGRSVSVAVKKEADGRGGSRWMHVLDEGETVAIDGPRNHFALDESAEEFVLIGGGIGVTPIVAMARRLSELGKPFTLYYLVRDQANAAFEPILRAMIGDRLVMHYDDQNGVFDFATMLDAVSNNAQVYLCGPEPMLEAVLAHTKQWPDSRIHYERFGAAPTDAQNNHDFEVVINSTGASYFVPPTQSILEVLDQNGHAIPYACESGICGSCMVDVLEGEIDHRDDIIDEADKAANNVMCVCVSRAKGERLVLDL